MGLFLFEFHKIWPNLPTLSPVGDGYRFGVDRVGGVVNEIV